MEEYIRLRDEVVIECSIEKLEKLMKKYNPEMYPKFKNSNEIVKLATLHKMACNIPSMPEWRKEEARKWLKKYGMSEEIK